MSEEIKMFVEILEKVEFTSEEEISELLKQAEIKEVKYIEDVHTSEDAVNYYIGLNFKKYKPCTFNTMSTKHIIIRIHYERIKMLFTYNIRNIDIEQLKEFIDAMISNKTEMLYFNRDGYLDYGTRKINNSTKI